MKLTDEQLTKAVEVARTRMDAGEHHFWAIRLGLAYALGPEGYAAALANTDGKGSREFLTPDVYMAVRNALNIPDEFAIEQKAAA
jgi:hypothetical protein